MTNTLSPGLAYFIHLRMGVVEPTDRVI